MSLKRNVTVAGLTLLAAAGLALGGTPAFAATPSVPFINNGTPGPGEAGYFVNDNGGTRIRDVQFTTVVTAQMENLSGVPSPGIGGVGGELCNDNTGWAAQVGIVWNGTAFQDEYNYTGNPSYGGTGDILLASPSQPDQDPCAEGGLLNSGNGEKFGNTFVPHVGDTVHFEIYYNPLGKHRHSLTFKEYDYTQHLTRVQTVSVPAQDLYEAGIGVVSENTTLTGGPVNLINTFTGTSFNYYSSRTGFNSIYVPRHWDLEEADFVNGSNQVTLSPNNTLNSAGNSFAELEGSTSA